MAHYTTDIRVEDMDLEYVGFDPETRVAHFDLKRVIRAEGKETIFIKYEIVMPLDQLNYATAMVNQLVADMELEGNTEFELVRPENLEQPA
jgi:hypothetical protein